LGDFVGVMDGNVVDAACVNVKLFTELFYAHGRTFNVPAGVTPSPGAVPDQRLIFKFAFGKPQREIVGVAFVFVNVGAGAGFPVIQPQHGEFPVRR
jgi:hypothetical protein